MFITNEGAKMRKKRQAFYENELVMSVPMAAMKLGISRDAAYRAAKAGDLPTIKIGDLLRVPIAQLNRMLEGK
jgi:excisionase family DNA binding protein